MPKKGKNIRCQYSVKSLSLAVDMVKNNHMSIRQVAKHFNVPKSTIPDRISGRVDEGAKRRKAMVFPKAVEEDIARKVKVNVATHLSKLFQQSNFDIFFKFR